VSAEKRLSLFRHVAGLAFAAVATACLAVLWTDGLTYLRGTVFEDLSSIVFAVVAIAFLTLADRIARAVTRQ
jgi:hypothetical protein